jgi:transketolase
MLRLIISPSPRPIALPGDYRLTPGQGAVVREGSDTVLFAYGPVMLNEALSAAESLQEKGISLKVVNLPWLNQVDAAWLRTVIGDCRMLFSLDNHSPYGGIGDCLLNALMSSGELNGRRLVKFGIEGMPACGAPPEVLAYHGVDGNSLAERIAAALRG